MTREEAIHKMEYSKRAYQMLIDEKVQEGILVGQGINAEWSADTPIIDAYKDMLEACDMAIKALEQKPCSNAIDRDEAIRVASGYCHFSNIPKELAKLPPVTVEPKTGHWNCGDDMFEYAICSSCKHETGEAWEYAKRNFKYCPNCGARMVGEEDVSQ